MDPTVALNHLRELVREISDNERSDEDLIQLAVDMAVQFQALDTWLSKGGFLPVAWSR